MNDHQRLVSVVVPAFNEARLVAPNLDELFRYTQTLAADYRFEYIVVDDGSSDGTAALVDEFARTHEDVTIVHHPANRGLGAALRTGFELARGEAIVVMDLDLSYAPYHIPALLHALEQDRAAIAIASPYLKGGSVRNVPWARKHMSSWANRYLSVAAGGKIATLTGMVRAYDAAALRTLSVTSDGMDINHELVFAALKHDMLIVEIPANLEWREPPDVPGEEQASAPPRRSSMRSTTQAWRVLLAGFRHRPSMALALPALVPGFLPFVLAIVLLLRPSHEVLVNTTLATLVVQFSSLGFLVLGTGSYLHQLRSITRRAALHDNGTQSHA